MAFIQKLGQLRAPVQTYAQLPITGNVLGDLRILSDLGSLWVWMSSNADGALTDWKKVTVSSYTDLVNRPVSSQLDIDNAILSIRNLCLNYILLFFKKIIQYGVTIQKMYDGLLDNFQSSETIDLVNSSNYKYIISQGTNTTDYFYTQKFNANFDEYTKILMHGNGMYNDSGFDSLRNQIINIWKEESGGYFQAECIRTSPYPTPTMLSNYAINAVTTLNQDFTWDFWYKELAPAGDKNILQYGDGTGFIVKKLADDRIYVLLKTCDSFYWDYQTNGFVILNPVDLEVTSISTLAAYTWNHVAVERHNGYLKLFINGVLEATSVNSSNNYIYNTDRISLGYNSYPTWLDEVRYSEGIARYTSNFTPMTVPYDTSSQSIPCDNMSVQSNGFEANYVPTSARIVIFQDYTNIDPQNVLPNTDLKAFVSRDGGTTFTQVTLVREMDIPIEGYTSFLGSSVNFYVGTVDLSLQPNGQLLVWKITTHNNVRSWIRSLALNWR